MSSSSQITTTTRCRSTATNVEDLIAKRIETIKWPDSPEIKFLPHSCIPEIARFDNIKNYISEDAAPDWNEQHQTSLAEYILRVAPKIFISIAKTSMPAVFLRHIVDEVNFKDDDIEYTGIKIGTGSEYNGEGGLRDQLIEALGIHRMQNIECDNVYDPQVLNRKEFPLKSITKADLGCVTPVTYNVTFRSDYWNFKKKLGLDFILVELKDGAEYDDKGNQIVTAQEDDKVEVRGDAIAAFWIYHNKGCRLHLLFPKDSLWLGPDNISQLT